MKASAAIAEILKREGVSFLIGYPVNTILEAAAQADIRTIIVRQERVGLHMADAVSRVTSGQTIGCFAMQHGPGSENSFGGVAQAYGESIPLLVIPQGFQRDVLAGKSPVVQLNVDATRMSQAFAGSGCFGTPKRCQRAAWVVRRGMAWERKPISQPRDGTRPGARPTAVNSSGPKNPGLKAASTPRASLL